MLGLIPNIRTNIMTVLVKTKRMMTTTTKFLMLITLESV